MKDVLYHIKQNKAVIFLTLIILVLAFLWIEPLDSIIGFNFGLKNDWWLDLVYKDGSIDGSSLSSIFNTFLMIPIQIAISFLVFHYAYKSFVQLRIQTQFIKYNNDELESSRKFDILCKRIESDFVIVENSIADLNFDYISLDAFGFYRSFLNARQLRVGQDFEIEFRRFYRMENRSFLELEIDEIAKILVDNWFFLVASINKNFLKGSNKGAGICSAFIALLENKNEKQKKEIFSQVFSYLLGHSSHDKSDLRFTVFYMFYSYKAITGNTSIEIYNFLKYVDSRIKGSFLSTKKGDESLYLAKHMASSSLFKLSLSNDRSLDISIKDNIVQIFGYDDYRVLFSIVKIKNDLNEITKNDIENALSKGHYVGDKIYII